MRCQHLPTGRFAYLTTTQVVFSLSAQAASPPIKTEVFKIFQNQCLTFVYVNTELKAAVQYVICIKVGGKWNMCWSMSSTTLRVIDIVHILRLAKILVSS